MNLCIHFTFSRINSCRNVRTPAMKLAWGAAHFHAHFTIDTSELCRGKGRTPHFCAYARFVHEAPGLYLRVYAFTDMPPFTSRNSSPLRPPHVPSALHPLPHIPSKSQELSSVPWVIVLFWLLLLDCGTLTTWEPHRLQLFLNKTWKLIFLKKRSANSLLLALFS